VEADREAAQTVRANAAALGLAPRCRVHHGDVLRLLRRGALPGPFALVLADPPWSEDAIPSFLAALVEGTALDPGATLVVERDADRPLPVAPPGLRHVRSAGYGRTALDFFAAESPP
jgi:16S rRNA G966 N2-methylase RsmD